MSKMHMLRIWMEGQRVRYGVPWVWMNGVRLPVLSESEYIRSLARHALPHTYHKEDFRKLMTAARCASAVIPLESLQPHGLRQPLPALSGVLGRPAAVVYMCIQAIDLDFALSQPTEAASAAHVYLIDTDLEWAVRHAHADHLHLTGLAPRRCVLWDPRTPWAE